MSDILERAYEAHLRACEPYDDGFRVPGLAYPFGRPDGMPEHEWRVSSDVMQALTEAAPPPKPAPNPKTADDITRLLFGWPIVVDESAPNGTLELTRRDVS
jgi:hypothetical protein